MSSGNLGTVNYIHTYNRQISIILCSEPNQWKPPIAADAHAKDFVILSEVLTEVKPLGNMIVGPDVTYGGIVYFSE